MIIYICLSNTEKDNIIKKLISTASLEPECEIYILRYKIQDISVAIEIVR